MPRSKSKDQRSNSEIRRHYFLKQYVVIAPDRKQRPDDFSHSEPHKVDEPDCHLCGSNETGLWQIPKGTNWRIKVVKNAYPALSESNPRAYGVQELVINTPSHAVEFSELPVSQIEEVFAAYRNRISYLRELDGIRYVLIFKNDGPLAGASLSHAHCQIFALPLIPPKIEQESDALNHYWDEKDSCAYCDILEWEEGNKVRIIYEDKHFVAISPYASSHAFEAWLIPRRHEPSFMGLQPSELNSLAVILKKITSKLDSESISFNYFLQESLENQNHHFVLKLEPRTTKWAGAELGTGVIINPVTPEFATLWYQGKI
jgi:UDPglucose--hexose-1-phosphate uridylyltransferase